MPLPLSLACWDYAHTRALADGQVQPEGIDLVYLPLVVEETFFRMLRYREFDASELSLSSYCVSLMRDDPPFIAIPVFPSRSFRHNSIVISSKSEIAKPADLRGKRVGTPEYQLTAIVWQRGILADHYGVHPNSVTYFTGGLDEPGREEKLPLSLPPGFRVQNIGNDTLSRMIADGDIDAIYAPRLPATFRTRPKEVRRLFVDYRAVERDYFANTRIFPIMHVIVIRRDVYRAYPWVALSLQKAFVQAQKRTYDDLGEVAALKSMLPWQTAAVEDARREMGTDWWPYGFAPNRHVLETFLRYHYEQGLSRRLLAPEELFAPETMEAFTI